jgi:hypothetical protein
MSASLDVRAIPDMLLKKASAARFALFSDGQLIVIKGETTVLLDAEDIRALDRFFGTFGDRT